MGHISHSFLIITSCPYPLLEGDLLTRVRAQITFNKNGATIIYHEWKPIQILTLQLKDEYKIHQELPTFPQGMTRWLDQFQSHSQRLGEWTWQNTKFQLSLSLSLMLSPPRCGTTPCPVRQRRKSSLILGTSLNYGFWFLSSDPGIFPWSPLKNQTQMITHLCRNFGRSITGLWMFTPPCLTHTHFLAQYLPPGPGI